MAPSKRIKKRRPESTSVVLMDPEGHILVLRRGNDAPWKPGHWDLPGGYLEFGESPEEGANRELLEETGMSIGELTPLLEYTGLDGKHRGHVFFSLLPVRVRNVRFPDGEHTAFRWVKPDKLPFPSVPSLKLIVSSTQFQAPPLAKPLGTSDAMHDVEFIMAGMDDPRDPGQSRWPQYLPLPTAIPRWEGDYSVPNENAINWPQAQFAPEYLTPGSPSFQPYRYGKGSLLGHRPTMFEVCDPALMSIALSEDAGRESVPCDPPALTIRTVMPADEALAGCGCSGYGDPDCKCGGECCQSKAKSNPAWSDPQKLVLAGLALIVGWQALKRTLG